jgi:ribosomal protein L24E
MDCRMKVPFRWFATPGLAGRLVFILAAAGVLGSQPQRGQSQDTQSAPTPTASTAETRQAQRTALEPFQTLVGGWRGVGQPKRGSNVGAWSETAEWVWDLKGDNGPALCVEFAGGKQLQSARLGFDPDKKEYVLEGQLADDKVRTLTGVRMGNRLVLESHAEDQTVHQVTLTLLNDKRTLLLYQTRNPRATQFTRVAEVGYTRAGTRLAEEAVTGRECIVTGGLGTIQVEHKGQTYWVCCTGCREAFADDPEGVLAEAKKRGKQRE